MAQQLLHIPDVTASWPWPRRIHPSWEDVAAESNAWLRSFAPFTPKSQLAFEKCDFGRLAALAYPDASPEHLRAGIDLINLLFVIDEYTDVAPPSVVKEMTDIVNDAFRNPQNPRPVGESIIGEMARQVGERIHRTATSEATSHFLKATEGYLQAVVLQAGDRRDGSTRSISEFIEIRREDNGSRPTFSPFELHLSIPDVAFYYPAVVDLQNCVIDMTTSINDITSYNREQATGNDHYNLLAVIMRRLDLDYDGAMAWVVDFHNSAADRFIKGLERLPSFGPEVDAQLQEYIESLANWPLCVDSWGFESQRYFGEEGLKYQTTRQVPLLPKKERLVVDAEQQDAQVQVYQVETPA